MKLILCFVQCLIEHYGFILFSSPPLVQKTPKYKFPGTEEKMRHWVASLTQPPQPSCTIHTGAYLLLLTFSRHCCIPPPP